MNYTTLQTTVANYLHRTDLTPSLPTFIELAESYIFRELNIKDLETPVSGVTIADGYITLPADFGSVSRLSVTSGSVTYNLDYSSQPKVYAEVSPYPRFYSFENAQLRISNAGADQAYTLYYKTNITALSGSNASNWVLANGEDLYFYATALEAAKHIRDSNEVARLTPLVAGCLDSLKRFNERRGMPSNGSMRITPRR